MIHYNSCDDLWCFSPYYFTFILFFNGLYNSTLVMSYQDWKPVVWTKHENFKGPNKESALNKARRAGVELDTQKKCNF